MKKLYLLLLPLLLTACGGSTNNKGEQVQTFTSDASEQAEEMSETLSAADENIETSMNGTISPDTWTPGEEATVTFSAIPTTVSGFEKLRSQIGNTPQGAVALQLIAFEMYNKNTGVGTKCVEMNNTDINVPSVMRRLPEIFGKNNPEDSYVRKHLVATFFDGATPENGFNPNKPYTIKVRTSKVREYERAESLKGYVLYLEVYSTGYDTSWRGCEVVKQKGDEYYKVSNSPSMYVQCKEVPFDSERDYEGI